MNEFNIFLTFFIFISPLLFSPLSLSLSLINDTFRFVRNARRFFPQDVSEISHAWITRRWTEAKDRWHSVHVNTEYGSNALNGLNACFGIASRDHTPIPATDLLQLRRPWSRISFAKRKCRGNNCLWYTHCPPSDLISLADKRFAKFRKFVLKQFGELVLKEETLN